MGMHPEVCPVCQGRGSVPYEFYHGWGESQSTAQPGPVTCRSCWGCGYVQMPDAGDNPKPFDPRSEFKAGTHA